MKLIIGLGNPGDKYKNTRHNAGFLTLDEIQKNIEYFSNWHFEKQYKASIAENENLNIILAKPQTFMNSSGQTAKILCGQKQISAADILIVHDDLDLLLGKFKLQKNRGPAGHKGVKSIIDALNTRDFWRLRIGIKPADKISFLNHREREKFVLGKFRPAEGHLIKKAIKQAIQLIAKPKK